MSPARLTNGNGATMTQAPTPTADTVRRLVLSLLKDGGEGRAGTRDERGTARDGGPDIRPATEGAEPAT
jgi:hypothetical protein